MANKPDMVIQINVSAPGVEATMKALTDAILQSGVNPAEVTIPAGSALQITGMEAVPAAETAQPTQQVAPAPQPVPGTAQTPAPVPPPAPAPVPGTAQAPAPVAQQQAAPVPQPQIITLDAICNAGAKLVEQGQMNQVIALLGKYGVQAVNQIRPEQFEAFAADLRGLGAQI